MNSPLGGEELPPAHRGEEGPDQDTWYWEKQWNDFRRGTTGVRLSWDGGETIATLYDVGVPKTVAAFLAKLPMKVPVVHVAWSGDMVMSTGTHPLGLTEQENRVRLVRVGDLGFDPKFDEITVTYGTAEARLPDGPNTLTVFGQITGDMEAFTSWARLRRFEGIGTITFELITLEGTT